MKVSRLYQPRNPKFWLLVTLNLLSTGLAFGLRQPDVGGLLALLMGVLALGNAVFGMRLMWSLMRDTPNTQDRDVPAVPSAGDPHGQASQRDP